MDALDSWFPYEQYRPNQREMLETALQAAENGSIAMIDAPTGSGKSSVVSALLAVAEGRKVIVAVRTVSQLNTFIRELEMIRKKCRKGLTFSYLVGKRNVCPMARAAMGDTYRLCEGLKAFSSALMRERSQKTAGDPSKDKEVQRQIERNDPEHPLICPYFIRSKTFAKDDEGTHMVISQAVRSRGEKMRTKGVRPQELGDLCGRNCCPYEVMMQAAREADVVIVNFHHIFNPEIREQMYQSLEIDAANAFLLIDEAHNCGDTVQSISRVHLGERMLEQAQHELHSARRKIGGADAVLTVLPAFARFTDSLKRSRKTEDWFDPRIFTNFVLRGSLYTKFDDLVDDLLRISEAVRESNTKNGEYKETGVERLCDFCYRVLRSLDDRAYLTVYLRDEEEMALEVRNIDPAPAMIEVASAHAATVLISGTLSPIGSYKKLYFEDLPVVTKTFPNPFPPENRMLCCASDITSAYRERKDPGNVERIQEYIRAIASIPGNVAVYFPSYDLLNRWAGSLGSSLRGKQVFVESPSASEAGEDLKRFMALPSQGRAGVLLGVCGGKWSEGLDYRGDLLCGALVIGLPLAPFNEVRRITIGYYRGKFGKEGEFISYTVPAINKAVQALGRVLRASEDRGVLLLGDRRFLEGEVRKGLPVWMQEEIQACEIGSFRKAVGRW